MLHSELPDPVEAVLAVVILGVFVGTLTPVVLDELIVFTAPFTLLVGASEEMLIIAVGSIGGGVYIWPDHGQ
jgi:hypothetical protein